MVGDGLFEETPEMVNAPRIPMNATPIKSSNASAVLIRVI